MFLSQQPEALQEPICHRSTMRWSDLLSGVNLPLGGMSWVPVCFLPLDSVWGGGEGTAVIVGVVGGVLQT